jgi:nucleoporin NUP2
LVLQNFKVYAGLNVTRKAKFVSFVGHDNGASTTFRLRVKTEADAVDLKNAIDKDVAAVEAKAK